MSVCLPLKGQKPQISFTVLMYTLTESGRHFTVAWNTDQYTLIKNDINGDSPGCDSWRLPIIEGTTMFINMPLECVVKVDGDHSEPSFS